SGIRCSALGPATTPSPRARRGAADRPARGDGAGAVSRQPPSRERYEGIPVAYSGPRPLPGREALLLAAFLLALLMLGLQLWLLTIALGLYLGGDGDNIWALALVSGV